MECNLAHSSLTASVVEDRAYARWITVLSNLCNVYPCDFGNATIIQRSRFSIHLCFNLHSILDYFRANKGDLVINRKLHRKRKAGVEAIKGSKKINCSIRARHSCQGVIHISSV